MVKVRISFDKNEVVELKISRNTLIRDLRSILEHLRPVGLNSEITHSGRSLSKEESLEGLVSIEF